MVAAFCSRTTQTTTALVNPSSERTSNSHLSLVKVFLLCVEHNCRCNWIIFKANLLHQTRGRMGMKSAAGGEILQVQGGHTVRSTGRKDRQSKVNTAKGPRDRRVRLSAHTAIQFYDVQDRLGYDRPSKAVDWLIKKAKIAIDKLTELPPWQPTIKVAEVEAPNEAGTSEMVISAEQNFQLQRQQQQQIRENNNDNNSNNSSFISPRQSLDSDSIADTMKSFFPTSSAASIINLQSYPSHEMISRTTTNLINQDQDQHLNLSLHSFQDQHLIHQTNQDTHHDLFAVPATLGFDSSAYQRMLDENRGRAFVFNNMMLLQHQHQLQQHNNFSAHRGTLQSSSFEHSSSFRSWSDEIKMESQRTTPHSSFFGSRFTNEALPVFCTPTRIHGDDPDGDRPSSTSSPSSTHH